MANDASHSRLIRQAILVSSRASDPHEIMPKHAMSKDRQSHHTTPSMSTQRSHHSCWTCKHKRRRCDNTRPTCNNCRQRDQVCEGYEVRLRWGTGIASRGRYTMADKPTDESIPARPRGRQRDRSRDRRKLEALTCDVSQASEVDPGPHPQILDSHRDPVTPWEPVEISPIRWYSNPEEQALFQEFLRSGVNVLHATTVEEGVLGLRLSQLSQHSKALYTACIAFQASLSDDARHRFTEYFEAAQATFRMELSCCGGFLKDETWNAGLLLCSISLMRGFPWTIHLQGMHSILRDRYGDSLHQQETPSRKHLLEVMAVMDLPTFSIGRRNPCIDIWHRYGCAQGGGKGVEMVTGIPRSLLDIFSGVGKTTVEEDFWNWPGELGDFLQSHLWEAHRLAGILTIRRCRAFPILSGRKWGDVNIRVLGNISSHLPTTEVLVMRILANLDAARRGCNEEEAKLSLIMNGVNYPLFVTGLELNIMNSRPEWKRLIRNIYCDSRRRESGVGDRLQLRLLELFWERNDVTLDVNDLARGMDWELALL